MTMNLVNRTPHERFQHLLDLISSERFLKKQGLNFEVPFFIGPYRPEDAVEMGGMQKQLMNRLNQNGIRTLEINLYDMAISLLKRRGVWDQIISVEITIPKNQLKELLQGILDPETHLSKTEIDALLSA